MKPERLRKLLGLTRAEFARALGVTERTVARWDDGTAPQGLAAEVFRGIEMAISDGLEPERVGRMLRMGVGTVLHRAFTT